MVQQATNLHAVDWEITLFKGQGEVKVQLIGSRRIRVEKIGDFVMIGSRSNELWAKFDTIIDNRTEETPPVNAIRAEDYENQYLSPDPESPSVIDVSSDEDMVDGGHKQSGSNETTETAKRLVTPFSMNLRKAPRLKPSQKTPCSLKDITEAKPVRESFPAINRKKKNKTGHCLRDPSSEGDEPLTI